MSKALPAILLVATTMAAQADPSQYLCVAERSAELHYDRQAREWAPWALVTDDRFVLRRLNDDDRKAWASNAQWGFFKLAAGQSLAAEGQSVPGEAFPTALCGFDLNNCSWGTVEFDSKDGVLTWRWYKDNQTEPGDVVIEAGKCSAH